MIEVAMGRPLFRGVFEAVGNIQMLEFLLSESRATIAAVKAALLQIKWSLHRRKAPLHQRNSTT